MPSKRPIHGTPENSFWDPKWVFWGDFPWRMRVAKVDLLCAGELHVKFENHWFLRFCATLMQIPLDNNNFSVTVGLLVKPSRMRVL